MINNSSALRSILLTSALSAIPVGVGIAFPEPVHAFGIQNVRPIYRPADIPDEEQAQFDSTNLAQRRNANNPASFGYFFETTTNNKILNALGFAVFTDWGDQITDESEQYIVTLWKYINNGGLPADYEQIATVTFYRNLANNYVNSGGYYWLPLDSPLDLGQRSDTNDTGFVVAAVGFFSEKGMPFLFNGTGDFDPSFAFDDNGLNVATSAFYDLIPLPFDYTQTLETNIGQVSVTRGFFNPNISYVQEVPGPLPLFGAAAAFGWSRRLRRRISSFN